MMKRITISLVCPLIGVLLMTSCLGNDDEIERSSAVSLQSFEIKDLKTVRTFKKADGTDSTYVTIISGKSVIFTIDQSNRLVYNTDSIDYGTDVSHVLVNVKADGGVAYVKADGTLGSVEDSIDFARPVTFRVTSYDERFFRDYKVSVNAHQVDPGQTVWKKIEGTNLPSFVEQKTFVRDNSLYVIGVDADGVYYTASAALADVSVWTTTPCSGIEGTGLSALLVDDIFYLKTDTKSYRSENAVEWVEIDDEVGVLDLPEEIPMNRVVALFRQPLSTNPNIVRSLFVAIPETADSCAQVWTKLSTEDKAVEIGSSGNKTYGCPNLNNLSVIQYAGNMYAFGLKSMGESKEFSSCYESRDNGVTWKVNEEAFSLPKDFGNEKYTTESFSAATDGEYVWVMWSNGEVWRGRWNGL